MAAFTLFDNVLSNSRKLLLGLRCVVCVFVCVCVCVCACIKVCVGVYQSVKIAEYM